MGGVTLRVPNLDDWPAILALPDQSLAEFAAAPSQREFLDNRRSFTAADGIQEHSVATRDGRIVGYACAERRNNHAEGEYRLFVVVAPPERRTLGTFLFAKIRGRLVELGATLAWLLEYEADTGFIKYLEEIGFQRLRKHKLDDGNMAVVLKMSAPFQSLAQPDSTAN